MTRPIEPRLIDLGMRLLTMLFGALLLWFAAEAFSGMPAPLIHGLEGLGPMYPMWSSRAEAICIGVATSAGGMMCVYTALHRTIH